MRKWSMQELNRMSVDEFRKSEKLSVTVLLDNVRSMHNVGSIFRTADAFLIEKIVLCGYTPKPPHRDINKTALGATETIAWEYIPDILDALRALKALRYRIIAVEQAEGSTLLPDISFENEVPLCIIFGNEVDGVQDSVLSLCDAAIEIPQLGSKHSLNVSVAAGIVLYKLAELISK